MEKPRQEVEVLLVPRQIQPIKLGKMVVRRFGIVLA